MTARERRTIRWGAAAAGVIFGWVLVVDPWLVRGEETRALAAEREARLSRLEALRASLPAWRDRLEQSRGVWSSDVAPRLLPGDVPAVAASFLSEEVRRFAARSYLDIERESVLPSGERDGFVTVPVQFSLRGDVYGLRDFLAALESAVPFLHLRELRVTSAGTGFTPAGAAGTPLQLTITLEGYLAGAGQPGGVAPVPVPGSPPDAGLEDGAEVDDMSGVGAGGLGGVAAPDVDPDVPGAPPRSPAPAGRTRMEDQGAAAGAGAGGATEVGAMEKDAMEETDAAGEDDDVIDPEVE